ncbi:arylsulfotransferase family protein [Aspergillus stella-maris]|uniref:arylsulfotransferase family protein n=1 Tax=Aspergillus stella-maris TaxID=1810926 RepID=UPI003CCE4D9B
MVRPLFATCSALLFSLGALADNWPFMTLQTAPFAPPDVSIEKSGVTDPGYIFIGPRGNQPAGTAALIYDEDGNLVYQGPTEVTANFKVQKLFNEDVITFWAGDMMKLGFGYGTVHILDDTYREIYTVTLKGDFTSPDGASRDSYIDLHESRVTSRNTLLVTAYNVIQHDLSVIGGRPTDHMLDSKFYEIDIATNEVVFEWSTFDHIADIPLEESKQGWGDDVGSQETPYDAYHINSVELFDEGYIISLRHYWSGYYIHNNGTVMWRLGGEPGKGDFELDRNGEFSWQHDIRIYNETQEGFAMTLFNNANTPSSSVAATTGLSFDVDLVNFKAKTTRVLNDTDDVIHSVSQGSYQLLSEHTGHVAMGYGSIAEVKEFDADNNEVLTVKFGEPNAVASYRGYKCQWKATPFWKPAVVVQRTGPSTVVVHMSWNGATEYDNWAVYSSAYSDGSDPKFQALVNRAGFESTIELNGLSGGFLQVIARKGDIPLGSSDVASLEIAPADEPAPTSSAAA